MGAALSLWIPLWIPLWILLWISEAQAVPSLGEGAQQVTIQITGTDQPVVVERVGVGRLPLSKELSTWEGQFRGDPARFLQLRVWEGTAVLWEGTLFLTDQYADTFCFRVVDLPPRTLLRVATVAPPPKIGSLPMDGFGMTRGIAALAFVVACAALGWIQRRPR